MHPEIYDELKRVAKAASYTTYSDIAPLAELDMDNPSHRDEIGQILGEISKYEHSQGRPMLSAVVIHRDNNMPGKGFFKLARELGVYAGSDDLKFYLDELKRVHQYWGVVAI
jgi:hypothetical protein